MKSVKPSAFIAGLVVFPVIYALGFTDFISNLSPGDAEGVLFIAQPAITE